MENKVTKTSTRLSKIEGLLGVTEDLDVASGYTVLGGLATLTGQVQEMKRMLALLLDKEKSTPSPRRESDVENSSLVTRSIVGVASSTGQWVIPGARIYDPWCCATTPSTYGGARHAYKPGHNVQYLWWYELGHCATMSSTYGGTNLGDISHRPVPMVNLSWKFMMDLSVELWEFSPKMTGLGSSGSYLSWTSPQLGVEAVGQAVGCQRANHPTWVVTPPRDTPLGGTSWQGAFPSRHSPWVAVGGLGRKGALLEMRLQDGGYKVAVILGGWCVKRHTHSLCLFKEDKVV
ncbi:hypothetical protein Cgig2_018970 [Carnegiea gigantea]|uniref:Uncharacterized protein n=1 Tax=Carnegiea gigantea TaxID=171969 RepID=A0A9Q1K1W2_9CARY|nr:hypothetical protein Cgig2_018970 [Carnegiea gigantea]